VPLSYNHPARFQKPNYTCSQRLLHRQTIVVVAESGCGEMRMRNRLMTSGPVPDKNGIKHVRAGVTDYSCLVGVIT